MAAPAGVARQAVNVTTAIRRVFLKNGNQPMAFSALFEQAKTEAGAGIRSKNHFREDVLGQMMARDELTKVRLGDDPRGRGKQLFGLRLKNTGYTRALLRKDGVRFGLSTEELSAALVAPLPEKKKEEAAVSVVADKVPAEAASAAAGAGASATGASTDSGKGKSFWQRFTGTRS